MKNIRILTASSLFDGHDASINVMRRILQDQGAEVIHLGHNRSVSEVVAAALQEGVQGIALSSYQGGHIEYFKYMRDSLDSLGAPYVRIFGGGGGVITWAEKKELEAYGVSQIFHPDEGRKLGLEGMIQLIIKECDFNIAQPPPFVTNKSELTLRDATKSRLSSHAHWLPHRKLGMLVHCIEQNLALEDTPVSTKPEPLVLGITGTGGSGKSSLTDELVGRVLSSFPQHKVAVFCTDPTKKKTGGALLGDRIRMNFLDPERVYMRSLASRHSGSELASSMPAVLEKFKSLNFDLLIVESSGIGQSSSQILELADVSLYVMTAEFGAQSQLEKIDMIDFADLIAINKADRQGAQDAWHDVKKQYCRSRKLFNPTADTPIDVFLTQSSNFNDQGVNQLFFRLCQKLEEKTNTQGVNTQKAQVPPSLWHFSLEQKQKLRGRQSQSIVPPERQNYLANVVKCVQGYHKHSQQVASQFSQIQALETSAQLLQDQKSESSPLPPTQADLVPLPPADSASRLENSNNKASAGLLVMKHNILSSISEKDKNLLQSYKTLRQHYAGDELSYKVRGRDIQQPLVHTSLSGLKINRVSWPQFENAGDQYRYMALENAPGYFPFTAGVYPLKRATEDATRMFAGLGTCDQTNKRFHFLSQSSPAKRLSTAFDSVTLYGEDPASRPDVFGKIGESGVSIATLDDMKRLYKGFDLCDPSTSVSMTINGPAPLILAFFLNTAIDGQIQKKQNSLQRPLTPDEQKEQISYTLQTVRGTLQADILKEDQGQNTCIFSTDFALKMMGDVQEYFVRHKVRNFYSVSISGYHIAEAGANPISQLAFTLSNAFTFVEYYLHRGFGVDEFAPNLSFFFSNGLDPEYTVMGRVARRIWAIAMRDFYQANTRSQKLKYHIQTSGRSLHAQEMSFNDIRTTLQAWLAISDHCNSLHTNAFDEALTTPTRASVRQAQAIQMILQKEFGFNKNENPLQGSYFVEQLTNKVEQAVLKEMLRINERGGVLGAMERQYQRSRIQEESLYYEHLKHSGELPLVGVNTFLNPEAQVADAAPLERCADKDKKLCLQGVQQFQQKHKQQALPALEKLKLVALGEKNIFAELMNCSRVCSLGQMSQALYEVGGRYRRNL